jgi:thiol-disulfide isomerase/thioredoxin
MPPSMPPSMPPTPPSMPPKARAAPPPSMPPQARAAPPPSMPPQARAAPPPSMPPQARAAPPPSMPPQARAAPPSMPPQENQNVDSGPSPFGAPLTGDQKGAFGQEWVGAFDGGVDFFAPASGDTGLNIPISMQQEYLTKKSLGTLTPTIMHNIDEKRTPGVTGSDFKPFDPSSIDGSLLDAQFGGMGMDFQAGQPQPGHPQPGHPQAGHPQAGHPQAGHPQAGPLQAGPPQAGPPQAGPPQAGAPQAGGAVEVHMIYGTWCGHSKRAMPAFEELVTDNSITTANGSPVKFVMTEDTSPGMKQFEKEVNGFPSYMLVKGDGSMEPLEGHDRGKESIIEAVKGIVA